MPSSESHLVSHTTDLHLDLFVASSSLKTVFRVATLLESPGNSWNIEVIKETTRNSWKKGKKLTSPRNLENDQVL